MNISHATSADITELVALINSAYRGEVSRKGWTTEADLLTGEMRTDESDLSDQMNKPGAVLFKCSDVNGSITGCVYLKKKMKIFTWDCLPFLRISKTRALASYYCNRLKNMHGKLNAGSFICL